MKEKFILFIIGLLVGATISTSAFYIYTTTLNTCNCDNQNTQTQMNGGNPPSMPQSQNGQPPEMPNGKKSSSNNS